jgi:hypothetical protein
MYSSVILPISSLSVGKENPRFVMDIVDERAAIEELIRLEPGKMLSLCQSLAKELLPFPFYLVKDESGRMILIDGNRRLAAMKILSNPDLIPHTTENKNLIDFCAASHFNPPKEWVCYVYDKADDSMFDLLEKLHVSDDTNLLWTPLAQYKTSKKMGGSKHEWMGTLLFYFDESEVDKRTTRQADKYSRLFSTFSSLGIKKNPDGSIKDCPEAKKYFDVVNRLFKNDTLTTRSDPSAYSDLAKNLFVDCDDSSYPNESVSFNAQNCSLFKGQLFSFDSLKVKFANIDTGEKKTLRSSDVTVKFKDPQGNDSPGFDSSKIGSWTISIEYLGNTGKVTINVTPTLPPKILFYREPTFLPEGSSLDLLSCVSAATNSYGASMLGNVAIKLNPNAAVSSTKFLETNPAGTYNFFFYFLDVDGSECSQVHQIVVSKVEPFVNNVTGYVADTKYLFVWHDNIPSINLGSSISAIINEMNSQQAFDKTPNMVCCSCRTVIELAYEKLLEAKKVDEKIFLKDRIQEMISKTLAYYSSKGLNRSVLDPIKNFLNSQDVDYIVATLHSGAHGGASELNINVVKEFIKKNISGLVVYFDNYYNNR